MSQTVARVDMDAPLGSSSSSADGGDGDSRAAYSPLERALTRLEALAGIMPFCPPEHAEIYRSACFCHSRQLMGSLDAGRETTREGCCLGNIWRELKRL